MLVEALWYRIGSGILSAFILFAVTGELAFATGMSVVLVLVSTLYYIIFRHLWRLKHGVCDCD